MLAQILSFVILKSALKVQHCVFPILPKHKHEFKLGGKLLADSSSYVFTPVRVPPSLLKGFANPCYDKPTSLSSDSGRKPTRKHGKSEIKGKFFKNDKRTKYGNFRGSPKMF